MIKQKIINYAKLIVTRGCNVQKGRPVLILATTEAAFFVELLAEEAYKLGACEVEVIFENDILNRLRYKYTSTEVLENIPRFRIDNLMHYVNNGASLIRVISSDPNNLVGLDADKIKAGTLAYNVATKDMKKILMAHKICWTICAVPGQKWADIVFPNDNDSVEKLWELILKCSYGYDDNPIADWQEHVNKMKIRKDKLNKMNIDRLHYTSSNGTDIVIGLCEDSKWGGGDSQTPEGIIFAPNIPTEEIYTVPHKNRIDGMVVSTKPLPYSGSIIDEGFSLRYKEGKVIDVKSKNKNDKKILEKIFEDYNGSKSLGEIALVDYNSPINQTGVLFYNVLFDENASCHLAIGNGISAAVDMTKNTRKTIEEKGMNTSNIHIDFMIGSKDMKCVGINRDGNEITIMENGIIVI